MFTTLVRQPIRRASGGQCNWATCASGARISWLMSASDVAADESAYGHYVKLIIDSGFFIKIGGRPVAIGSPAPPCTGVDAYAVWVSGVGWMVDVWKALHDGVWSSSVVIKTFDSGSGSPYTAKCGPSHQNKTLLTGCFAQNYKTGPFEFYDCFNNLYNRTTVTVNEDGTYSLV